MLFNSYAFLFVFLPVVLCGYQVAGRFGGRAVTAWLALASLVFYAYWHPAFLLVLLGSIALNYLAAGLISRQSSNGVPPRWWLGAAVAANLLALGYYKYFFALLGALAPQHAFAAVALPLGISFFTFTQISFLVDLYQGVAVQQDLLSYVLFVAFFPHLIAGPLLHHREMMPQFQRVRRPGLRADDLASGAAWFILGLAKKVLLADTFARTADVVFAVHGPVAAAAAWGGVLCYALELYFDFAGYSDMALGLARMFGIDFPLNFDSPYKASSVIEFWQRWHMTLSQYVAAYVFTPLQRLVRAQRRRAGEPVDRSSLRTAGGFGTMIAGPVGLSMLVLGVWHGAGLRFVLFGLLHGFYLAVNHAWRLWRPSRPTAPGRLRHAASVLLTFACVCSTWVFFRASGTQAAWTLLRSMAFGYPQQALPEVSTSPEGMGLVALLALGYAIVWWMPNTQQILIRSGASLHPQQIEPEAAVRVMCRPNVAWAVGLGLLLFAALVRMQASSSFLYFQF